jgi:hypothetical protein
VTKQCEIKLWAICNHSLLLGTKCHWVRKMCSHPGTWTQDPSNPIHGSTDWAIWLLTTSALYSGLFWTVMIYRLCWMSWTHHLHYSSNWVHEIPNVYSYDINLLILQYLLYDIYFNMPLLHIIENYNNVSYVKYRKMFTQVQRNHYCWSPRHINFWNYQHHKNTLLLIKKC